MAFIIPGAAREALVSLPIVVSLSIAVGWVFAVTMTAILCANLMKPSSGSNWLATLTAIEVIDACDFVGDTATIRWRAELIATLPHLESDETLLICNGVKDGSTLALIVAAQRLGKNVIPVMEKYGEFEQLMAIAGDQEFAAPFGVRIRLRTTGAGKWADSGGYRSKFGVSLPELIDLVERLDAEGAGERLRLLHFHLGSQISDIQQLRSATKEMAQIYAELRLRGIPVEYLDVGGGVGVNYTGGFEEGGINYSLQEYANAIVSAVQEVCADRKVPEPVLVSESGRAMTAHHSVLVIETLGAYRKDRAESDYEPPDDAHRMVQTLHELDENTRIVMLTGYASVATAVEAIKLGAVHYLTKPADADEILAALHRKEGNASVPLSDNPLTVKRLEWEHLQKVLNECDGNISAAARKLRMHRRTLQRKLAKRPVKE